MHLVKLLTLILLIVLIFMVALTVKKLKDTDAVKIDNLCKKGITIPIKAGSVIDSNIIKLPQTDENFTINLNC